MEEKRQTTNLEGLNELPKVDTAAGVPPDVNHAPDIVKLQVGELQLEVREQPSELLPIRERVRGREGERES